MRSFRAWLQPSAHNVYSEHAATQKSEDERVRLLPIWWNDEAYLECYKKTKAFSAYLTELASIT